MKRLILAAGLAGALAACGGTAEEADTATPETAAATPEPAPTSSAGTYEVTLADGTMYTSVLDVDGTYQDSDASGAVTESGTWEDRSDGRTCFDSEGGDDTVICFTVGEAAADGSMVATPDNGGDPLTIRRVEATAEPSAT